MSVAVPFDHPRKKGAMMQKANVSHEMTKMDKKKRRRSVTLRSSCKVIIYINVRGGAM
jgi:hypothetical protein